MIQKKSYRNRSGWLKARSGRIGGSDAAALLGLNPYKTNQELWEEKTGRRIPPDISKEPYVKYGHQAEAPLRRLFALDFPQYKVKYYPNNIVTNDKYPFAHASLDGELEEIGTGRKGILEIKTTSILQSMMYERWKDRIPDNYYCQVLWYLMITEYDFAVLKAQLKSEWSDGEIRVTTKHYFIERSEVLDDIEELRIAGEKMWKCIQEDRRPDILLPAI